MVPALHDRALHTPAAAKRLDEVVTASAGSYPDRVAIVDGSTRLTYAELDIAVSRVANLLLGQGVRPGDRVALDGLNGSEIVICYYAILRAGGVVVPLNVLIGSSLLAQRLGDSGAVLLICVVGADGLPGAGTARAAVDGVASCRRLILTGTGEQSLQEQIRDQPLTVGQLSTSAGEAAVISYPRRIPGVPKGVVLTHAAMVHNAAAIVAALYGQPGAPDVHLVALPLFHLVTQTMQLNSGIATGATLVLMPRFEPGAALQLIADEQVSILVAAPSMLWSLASAADQHPTLATAARGCVRLISSQLAPLPQPVSRAVEEQLGVRPLEGFGLSETGMAALHAPPGDTRPKSVGGPVGDVEVRLVDPNGAVVAGAGTGELQVRGPGLMREYYHHPQATAAAMANGWYRTGNIARREPDGHFVMVDRPTHLIMRGGLAIYRRAVEEALLTHPAISDAKVVAVPHPELGEEVHTVIERDPRAVVSEGELLLWAREQLPGMTGTDMELASAPPGAGWAEKARNVVSQLLPGIAFAAAGTAVAFAINLFVPILSPLTAGVLLGVVLANVGLVPARVRPGLAVSTRRLLRAGVVFLGLQLSLVELVGLGAPLLAVVVVTVVLGFLITMWVGSRIGLSRDLTLLTATGFSICGASAIAAMEGASDADEDEVATSIALVTIFGTIALFLWPLLQPTLRLGDEAYGAWSGASIHEVAQVVAAASPAGAAALATAVVVKLARVIMLAPMVATVSFLARRRNEIDRDSAARRPSLVPLFVLGFLAMIVVRSTGVLSQEVLDVFKVITTALLAAALFGLGTAVRVRVLLATGPRALVLGAVSTVAIAAVAYAGVLAAVGHAQLTDGGHRQVHKSKSSSACSSESGDGGRGRSMAIRIDIATSAP